MAFDSLTKKPGDKVALIARSGPSIVTIDKITPTGIVSLTVSTLRFNRNGTVRGVESPYHKSHLAEITPELKTKAGNMRMIAGIRAFVESPELDGLEPSKVSDIYRTVLKHMAKD